MLKSVCIAELFQTHKIATDITEVWLAMTDETKLGNIYIESVFFSELVPITMVMDKPYEFTESNNIYEIKFINLLNGKKSSFFRLVTTLNKKIVTEIRNETYEKLTNLSIDGSQIYLPLR